MHFPTAESHRFRYSCPTSKIYSRKPLALSHPAAVFVPVSWAVVKSLITTATGTEYRGDTSIDCADALANPRSSVMGDCVFHPALCYRDNPALPGGVGAMGVCLLQSIVVTNVPANSAALVIGGLVSLYPCMKITDTLWTRARICKQQRAYLHYVLLVSIKRWVLISKPLEITQMLLKMNRRYDFGVFIR